jgi:hypothetical protein
VFWNPISNTVPTVFVFWNPISNTVPTVFVFWNPTSNTVPTVFVFWNPISNTVANVFRFNLYPQRWILNTVGNPEVKDHSWWTEHTTPLYKRLLFI